MAQKSNVKKKTTASKTTASKTTTKKAAPKKTNVKKDVDSKEIKKIKDIEVKEKTKIQEIKEEVQEEKKSNSLLNFMISITIIIALSFFVYEKFIKINGYSYSDNNKIVLSDEKIDTLGKEKYQYMSNQRSLSNNELIFFKNHKVSFNTLEVNDILKMAYSMLSIEDKNEVGESSINDCFLDKGIYTKDTYPNTCYKETFDKNVLYEQIKNMFTENLKVEFVDFYPTGNELCLISNGNTYTCYLNHNDFKVRPILTLTGYDYSKVVDNKLYVYSYLLTIKREESIYSKEELGIYSDASSTKKIDNLDYYNSVTNGSISTASKELILKQYKDKATKYESVFERYNDNFVWIETNVLR